MNSFRYTTLILMATLCFLTACQRTQPLPQSAGMVHHMGICWLKEPSDPEARPKLMNITGKFSEIPGVHKVTAGRVIPSNRTIVDSSFDVAFIMSFSDQATMNAYLGHPLHKQVFQETVRPLVDRLVVYDVHE